jgi:methionyl-tRNA formyltransferase
MAPVKIVCLIGTPPYLNYFVNEIAAHYPPLLVIREDARADVMAKIRKKGLLQSARILWRQLRNKARYEQEYNSELGDQWQAIAGTVPVFTTGDINSAAVATKLRELRPDVVLVHGTSLIRDMTLEGLPLVLNLHWGLSPYYKGSFCTEWALINKDPYNIGYTIHRISSRIDGGAILTQSRVIIYPTDTANRINMRLTREGTSKMIAVLDQIAQARPLNFKPQDDAAGNLYLVKHFTEEQRKMAASMENERALKAMLDGPARRELPLQQ